MRGKVSLIARGIIKRAGSISSAYFIRGLCGLGVSKNRGSLNVHLHLDSPLPRESFYDNGPSARRTDLFIAIGTKPLVANMEEEATKNIFIHRRWYFNDGFGWVLLGKEESYCIERKKYASTRCLFVSKEGRFIIVHNYVYLFFVSRNIFWNFVGLSKRSDSNICKIARDKMLKLEHMHAYTYIRLSRHLSIF